ncbi:hypothetical protein [Saccharothrix xinjiangensis]|uniref:Uncharacterized protein n=1 Tax=Saccharothrix xinjiangensis TaxID=204798 RepID=A0ABV9Y1I4_9PSEU
MGEGLFRFVFNTLQPRMAQAGTRFYLPTVLTDLTDDGGDRVLPPHADRWQLGTLTGDTGTSVTGLLVSGFNATFGREIKKGQIDPPVTLGQFKGIPTPGQEEPTLDVSDATVDGLQNARLEPELTVTREGAGYRSRVTIAFGTFPDLPQAVTLTGTYRLAQSISIEDTKTKQVTTEHHTAPFDWPTFVAAGSGTFQVSVTDLWADVDWTLTLDGEGQPAVGIDALTVRGAAEDGHPTLTLDQLTPEPNNPYADPSIWKNAATEAFTSAQGQAELVARIQDTLNQPDNRDDLARGLTTNLRSVLDRTVGTASGSASVDDNLFDRFRAAVNDPGSDYYLPAAVFGITSPTLDPYSPDEIDFQVDVLGTPTSVTLTDNRMVGAANALTPAGNLAFDPGVTATALLSTLPDGTEVEVRDPEGRQEDRTLTAPLTLTGTATVTISDQDPFDGPYTVTVSHASVDITLPTSGGSHNALDTLTITCTALAVSADTDDITVDADIGDGFKQVINDQLNQPENKREVLDRVNEEIGDRDFLTRLGATITTNVRAMLTERLDG